MLFFIANSFLNIKSGTALTLRVYNISRKVKGTKQERRKRKMTIEAKFKGQVRTQLKDVFMRVRINSVERYINGYYKGSHHIEVVKVNVSVTPFVGKVIRGDVYLHYDWMLDSDEFIHRLDWSNLYD